MYSLLVGLTRSETALNFWDTMANTATSAVEMTQRVQTSINTAAARVVEELRGMPDAIRFEAGNAVREVTETLDDVGQAIHDTLPNGIVDSFVAEEQDAAVTALWTNLPRFDSVIALTEMEESTLLTTPNNARPRSFTDNVEALLDRAEADWSPPDAWQGIRERTAARMRINDIHAREVRIVAGVQQEEVRAAHLPILQDPVVNEAGLAAQDAAALDAQRLVLNDPAVDLELEEMYGEVNDLMEGLVSQNEASFGYTESFRPAGTTPISSGLVETVPDVGEAGGYRFVVRVRNIVAEAEEPASWRALVTSENQRILAAAAENAQELELVSLLGRARGMTDEAEMLEMAFSEDLPTLLALSEGASADILVSARDAGIPATEIDEFEIALNEFPAIEPIAVEVGELPAGYAVGADAAAEVVAVAEELNVGGAHLQMAAALGHIDAAVAAAVEAGEDADAAAAGAAEGVAAGTAGAIFGVMLGAAAIAEFAFLGTINKRHEDHDQYPTQADREYFTRLNRRLDYADHYIQVHRKYRSYMGHITYYRSMVGKRWVYMDPATGLFRIAECIHYTFRETIWSASTEEEWRFLRDNWMSPVVPAVPLPTGVTHFAPVTWPPLGQMWTMRNNVTPRTVFRVTRAERLYPIPLNDSMKAWNRRIIDLMRLRLQQALSIQVLRRVNQALGVHVHGNVPRESIPPEYRVYGPSEEFGGGTERVPYETLAITRQELAVRVRPMLEAGHNVNWIWTNLNDPHLGLHVTWGLLQQSLGDAMMAIVQSGGPIPPFVRAIAELVEARTGKVLPGLHRQNNQRTNQNMTAGDLSEQSQAAGARARAEAGGPVLTTASFTGTPEQRNAAAGREIRRFVDVGGYTKLQLLKSFEDAGFNRRALQSVIDSAFAAKASSPTVFHQSVLSQDRSHREAAGAATRASDNAPGNIPGASSAVNVRPADIMGEAAAAQGRPSTREGSAAAARAGLSGAAHITAAEDAGGHHHRFFRAVNLGVVARAHAQTVYSHALTPVWNPSNYDKGYSSHHVVPTQGDQLATTQSAVGDMMAAFVHPVGKMVRAATEYYLGNDPCRTTDRTKVPRRGRRMMQDEMLSGEEADVEIGQLGLQSAGPDSKIVAERHVATAETLPAECVTVGQLLDAQGTGWDSEGDDDVFAFLLEPDSGELVVTTVQAAVQAEETGVQQDVVESHGKTEVKPEGAGPAETTAQTVADKVVDEVVEDIKQDYTIYGVGGIVLVALLLLALGLMN